MGRPATLRVDIVTNAKDKGVRQADSSLGKFGSTAGKVGKRAAAGLAVVGAAALYAGKQVADSASRQEQAYGALDSIYGKSAARVKRWAKTSATSVGLARSEYAELAALVGAQLQGMGMETDKSATKSKQLIGVGADLAATFGGSVSDAVGAVSSLLKGERDPIERYGVSIKQADVNARLAALGLDGLTGAAAKQAQATATLSLLQEQTAKTTGAFARESNTLAGQQERLKAKFENVKATIGAKLLPMLVVLFTWLNDKLIPGASKLGRELGARFGPTLVKVGAWIKGTLVPKLRELWSWFERYIVPSLRRSVMPVLSSVRAAFRSVSSSVQQNSGTLSKLGRFLGLVVRAGNPVREMFGKLLGLAFRAAGKAISNAITMVSGLVSAVDKCVDAVSWLIDKLGALKNLNPGAVVGKIRDLVSGGVPLHGMGVPLIGGVGGLALSPGLATGSLTTAASSAGSTSWLTGGSSSRPTYVDARDFSVSVKVDGALDAPAVAQQLERILEQHARRMGGRR